MASRATQLPAPRNVSVMGAASAFWNNTTNTMVQTSVVYEMLGRVNAVFGMGVQMLAVRCLLGGMLAMVFGNQGTLVM